MKRIGMAPWIREAMDLATEGRLERRAESLHVTVSTIHERSGDWRVRVTHTSKPWSVVLRGEGPLEAVVAGALDDFEEAFAFTAEELVVIASQSDIPVGRA